MIPAGAAPRRSRVTAGGPATSGRPACLHDQRPGRDHSGHLRIAEFAQQTPYVPVDRLLPQPVRT